MGKNVELAVLEPSQPAAAVSADIVVDVPHVEGDLFSSSVSTMNVSKNLDNGGDVIVPDIEGDLFRSSSRTLEVSKDAPRSQTAAELSANEEAPANPPAAVDPVVIGAADVSERASLCPRVSQRFILTGTAILCVCLTGAVRFLIYYVVNLLLKKKS
eukprot:scpid101562/ scgid10963/ 